MAARVARVLPPQLALALLLVVCLAAPSSAQRLAYRVSSPAGLSFGIVDLSTGESTAATADEAQVGAVFTSDGQYAVSTVTGSVVLRHLPTGAQSTVPIDFRPALAHPRRAMLFGYTGGADVARLDERGMVRWTPCPATTSQPSFDVALDGRELFVACGTNEIVVLDTETGIVARRLAALGSVDFVAVNAAGELIVRRVTANDEEVARLEAATGHELSSRPALRTWALTGSRRQLMESNPSFTPGIMGHYRLVDSATLAVSRELPVSLGGARAFVSPDGRDAVLNTSGYSVYQRSGVIRLEVATGATSTNLAMGLGESIVVTVAPAPLPPLAPVSVVTGRAVSLSWQLPLDSPQATGYRLDLGSAPGATNLGTIAVGPGPSFAVSGVPAGRYYVRVRAVNVNGVSAPSSELTVDVP